MFLQSLEVGTLRNALLLSVLFLAASEVTIGSSSGCLAPVCIWKKVWVRWWYNGWSIGRTTIGTPIMTSRDRSNDRHVWVFEFGPIAKRDGTGGHPI